MSVIVQYLVTTACSIAHQEVGKLICPSILIQITLPIIVYLSPHKVCMFVDTSRGATCIDWFPTRDHPVRLQLSIKSHGQSVAMLQWQVSFTRDKLSNKPDQPTGLKP